jgi:hypothetical protein
VLVVVVRVVVRGVLVFLVGRIVVAGDC